MRDRRNHNNPGYGTHLPDRRRNPDRRHGVGSSTGGYRYPSWQEQKVQFYTRYFFLLLGVLFFNVVNGLAPANWSLEDLNVAFGVYFVLNSLLFLHASRFHIHPLRYHVAMWVDIGITSICVYNDPYSIPPTLLVFIMVVLGNGMRYGMRLFAMSLVGSFGAAMTVLILRHLNDGLSLSPGLLFLNLIGGVILIYAYILMGRIERSRRELELHSNLDTLTGLLNRRALVDSATTMFKRLRRNKQKFVLLFADLDKFKAINDELGHAAGDVVLKEFADILLSSIRSTDIAARYGGDEFVMLLEDTSMDEAEIVATRIQKQVSRWCDLNGVEFSVTFGLGEAPTHGDSFSSLLEQVDRALYHSKSAHAGGGLAHAECPP
ncbi:MAG TPA: GGDEF domain-containing protein [Gammaproteobacteria bacterium]|nr:GGDEF domain-containing protein [Gammaproteobacteria bacterium]